ncbi:hypothetical protein A4H97_17965 [Niastella yeongjuensis]|uniref:FecR protein domain-containing protein n=1 Tax=Niastella yeongjuensis TaxID=354355 RepID=A0A1V9DXN2_9BACT|nr:FecR domain-containing protein [Niastella yeongjuensis]OQP38612.1 hypothetical protein A4H97_17965 [Niastella yeongjuensis]SEO39543.1 FecR family protein [Niastella yeongjuensis]
MEKTRFFDLLAKIKSGEATPEEQLELNQHLAVSPDDLSLLKQIDECWEIPMSATTAPASEEVTTAWEGLRKKMSQQDERIGLPGRTGKVRMLVRYMAAIAAIFIVVLTAVWLWKPAPLKSSVQKNIVSTKNGSKSKIELPDGTQVWLNVGSRINYDENYGKGTRELTLTGEAYFDVAHNEKMPFVVHTGKMDIKVLGTIFNVKAYQGDYIAEAALIRGSIEVTFPGRPQEKLILRPHDKISIVSKTPDKNTNAGNATQGGETRPSILVSFIGYAPVDSAIVETSWVNNKLIFRGKTFEELSRDIERWFNVKLDVKNSSILSKKFTGTFSNESITEALDALSLSYPFHYKINKIDNTVTIQ